MVPPTATETITRPIITQTRVESQSPAILEPGLTPGQAGSQASLYPRPPTFTDKHEERRYLKRRLTLALRIFGKNGFDEGVAGHITVRDPIDPTSFWVNPFGVPFGMMNSSDLIQVDHEGHVIGGGKDGKGGLLNTAAFMIHSAIHSARPEVQCAAHSHAINGRAFATLGRELDITTQDSCQFYKDHALYNSFGGIVLAAEEGKKIATALGKNKAAILQNHGILTVGESIEAAIYAFTSLENCCRAQLMADAAAAGRGGTTVKITEEDAAYTYKTVGVHKAMWFSALPQFMMMERELKGEDWDDQK